MSIVNCEDAAIPRFPVKTQIEPFGNFFGKTITASAVRLKGQWLTRAGFLPGQQVSLKIVGQGAIELRVRTPSETPEQTIERLRVQDALDRADR
jgi:hypothetical protein